eukprot:360182-Chlamydomonas_euryale.AAC.1
MVAAYFVRTVQAYSACACCSSRNLAATLTAAPPPPPFPHVTFKFQALKFHCSNTIWTGLLVLAGRGRVLRARRALQKLAAARRGAGMAWSRGLERTNGG